jgi:uncharacterized protein with FMN-binding domain
MKRALAGFATAIVGVIAILRFHTQPEPVVALPPAASTISATSVEEPPTTVAPSTTASPKTASTTTTTLKTTTTTTSPSASKKTVTGDSVNTRWGPVQVQVTVSGTRVTAVQAVDYPNSNGRDQQINARAIPTLVSETLQAQSSNIDSVSGATYTSNGFIASLQSALSKVGLE